MRNTVYFLAMALMAGAQQTVAPSPDRAGSVRGETWNGYNIVDSMETGYRFATVGGDPAEYRSAVNYKDGVRLLGSYFTMNSKDGRGRWFDSMVVTTQGLGNDPYESAAVRVEKNRAYRYELGWRLNAYFNPGLVTALATGNHLLDTEYRMQDHDLTLFPDSKLRFFVGYTGTSQTGAGLSTVQSLQQGADVFPLFVNVRRFRREYRAGNEFRVLGVRVNWIRGWEDFEDDTDRAPNSAAQRAELYHGTSPYWRVSLFSDHKLIGLNGRFTYTAGRSAFLADETVIGPGAIQQSRQIQSFGDAQRPVATGNVNIVVAPDSKLTLVNSTSVYNVRTSGNSSVKQFDIGTGSVDLLSFQYLGIRTFANETDLNYQLSPLFGAFAGYEYSSRRIRSVQDANFNGQFFPLSGDQTNHLRDGRFGVRVRPLKALTFLLSAEVARNDRPFTPIAERNLHSLNGRVQFRSKDLTLAAGAESDYRFNSVTLSSYSSQSRKYFANGSWNVRPSLAFDGSFSRAHLYTIGGIAYFESAQLIHGESSLYLSNLNTLTAGVRLVVAKRADIYAAYVRSQDQGNGRSDPLEPSIGSPNPVFQAVQTFPMAFQSPLARVSLRIREKLRWNAGYQYYGYAASFYGNRNFRANTGYTSVTWSF